MFLHYSLSIEGTHHENQDGSGSLSIGASELFWVIDGATSTPRNHYTVADYVADLSAAIAESATQAFTECFDYDGFGLKGILRLAITKVRTKQSAREGFSATVAMAMVTQQDKGQPTVTGLVLGDATVALSSKNGNVRRLIHDNRLEESKQKDAGLVQRIGVRAYERFIRNTEGGFWVASTEPLAADRALVFHDHFQEGDVITLCSDGVTDLVCIPDLMKVDRQPVAQRQAVHSAYQKACQQGLRVDDTTITQVFAVA